MRIYERPGIESLHFDDFHHIDLDELSVVGLRSRGEVGDDQFGEVGDELSVLAVAGQGHLGAAVDLDGLGVINGDGFMMLDFEEKFPAIHPEEDEPKHEQGRASQQQRFEGFAEEEESAAA